MPDNNDNPFLQPAQAAQATTGDENPFAVQAAPQQTAPTGQLTNDVGNTVIVPKEGESFLDTITRAGQHGKTVTQDQINAELKTAPGKAATVLAAASAPSALASLGDLAIGHLARNVLPGMETAAAKEALTQAVPKVLSTIDALSKLGIGAGGFAYLVRALSGKNH